MNLPKERHLVPSHRENEKRKNLQQMARICSVTRKLSVLARTTAELCAAEIATKNWVEQVVIGMKLCPWANSVKQKGALRYKISQADTMHFLLQDAEHEISSLEKGLDDDDLGKSNESSDKANLRPTETTLLVVDAPAKSEFLKDFRSLFPRKRFFLEIIAGFRRTFVHAGWEIQVLSLSDLYPSDRFQIRVD